MGYLNFCSRFTESSTHLLWPQTYWVTDFLRSCITLVWTRHSHERWARCFETHAESTHGRVFLRAVSQAEGIKPICASTSYCCTWCSSFTFDRSQVYTLSLETGRHRSGLFHSFRQTLQGQKNFLQKFTQFFIHNHLLIRRYITYAIDEAMCIVYFYLKTSGNTWVV